ncbi:MAG TPA: MBL fold metallo-hydrolase [Pyrinomonadaceae bacterium]|nr:MBL fold metallo-hydrolase [Pyrinomonadaceae bacterium]
MSTNETSAAKATTANKTTPNSASFKMSAAKKSAAKKSGSKKSGAKKTGAKKTGAKKGGSKKPSGGAKPPVTPHPLKVSDRKHVKIRMYNVGFGDAFLLVVPHKERDRKVLVDCGVHSSGPNVKHSISEMARQIVADVTETDGVPRIDVVICTHRHQDHVSGFRDSSIWETVEVAEVWMPWTEDPKDPEARRIRETQSKTAKHLTAALSAKQKRLGASGANARQLAALAEIKELVDNSLTNAEAMFTLHEGFTGDPRRRYLPYKTHSRNSFKPRVLPGVTVHLMGPSRDFEVIRDMDPPKGKSYLRLMDAAAATDEQHTPFHSNWWIKISEFNFPELRLAPADVERIKDVGEGQELAVAVALEKAVNGTSLMIMFQIGKAYLLFPGDAQWGTWNAALNHPDWRPLLERTTFYKIGHHGSHNATPVEFVEEVLGKDFSAMASTRHMAKWKFIPKTELMEALRKKSKSVVRSDKPDPTDPPGFKREPDLFVETELKI